MKTVAKYERHAQRFGVECVYETARMELRVALLEERARLHAALPAPVDLAWMTPDERDRILDDRVPAFAACRRSYETTKDEMERDLLRLRIELEAIESARPVGLRGLGRPSRRRRSTAETTEAVRQLRAEGKIPLYIAEKLGITEATVRRLLKAENEPRNPAISLADSALNGKDGLAPAQTGSEQNPSTQLAFGV
jgi:hypothetical protein